MTPVRQSVLYPADGIGNGDCLVACLASLLDMPLWMVPPFNQMFARPDWMERIEQWARTLGYEFDWLDGHQVDAMPEFYIASGKSPRGVQHAVIYSHGKLVHDPHYSDAGIEDVDHVYYLRKSAP
jgi:hypothetical protein